MKYSEWHFLHKKNIYVNTANRLFASAKNACCGIAKSFRESRNYRSMKMDRSDPCFLGLSKQKLKWYSFLVWKLLCWYFISKLKEK